MSPKLLLKKIFNQKSIFYLALSIASIELVTMLLLEYLKIDDLVSILIDTIIIAFSATLLGRRFLYKSVSEHFETQQSKLLSTMTEGFVLQNEKAEIVYFNESALKILAMTAEQIQGKTSLDPSWKAIKYDGSPFPGEEHPAVKSLKTGEACRNVVMGVSLADGKIRWININSVPLFSENDSKVASSVICTFSDITNEKVNQLQLETANDRFKSAAEAVKFGVWDWNLKTGVLIWDPIMYQIYQIDQTDFTGDYDAFEKTLLPEDAIEVQKQLQSVFEKKEVELKLQFRITNKQKNIRHISAVAKCFYDQNSQIERIVGFNWDITKEYELNIQIEKQRLQITSQLKMASLGEMAGGIAHEINNPLSIIKGRAAQLYRTIENDQYDKENAKKYLDAIIVTSDRIAKIITGLRSFSRNAENDNLEYFSILTIINDTLALCQERFKNHGVNFMNSVTEDIKVQCRPTQISQVILNILNNSYDAIADSSEKWIKIEMQIIKSKEIIIAITDSGTGIKSELAEKIMQPFFTTKPVGKGTGLGLSISKGIIEDHGGRIELNTNSQNTQFKIHLPLTES